MDKATCKAQLRTIIRTKRLELSSQQQLIAERGLAKCARQSVHLLKAKRILSYSPFAGEVSPQKTVHTLSASDVYLPRITNFRCRKMQFYRVNEQQSLNKYGIIEPIQNKHPLATNAFDVILLPLIAFDRTGARVGMGAGYYDRALAALSHQRSTKPYLIGLAHHFQEVNSIESAPWDVRLDAILTDLEFIQI